ncbi:hypothetical protein HY933_02550 [Candidatus Falkowbacteria bacterium]|nr:hypothetical protein [Candidatus Falkowbacteria bacterium]
MKKPQNKKFKSTQRSLPIAEVRNDCLVMRDNTLRMVVMVSSINFALKSEDEQNAIIQAYMQFLNSIDYPLQIVVQSRKFNIDHYVDKLRQAEREQINDLLKVQIGDYIKFLTDWIQEYNIMTKKFYVVVPYDPLSDQRQSFWSRLTEIFSPTAFIKLSDKGFQQRREELVQRASHVMDNLSSLGLSAQILDTEQLIELFYISYNPDLLESEKIKDLDKVQVS